MVADNDADALELLVIDLSLEGHDVVGRASDGATCVRLALELDPDVVVVDYRMPPGMNGAEAARRMRRARPDLPVIVYSNYTTAPVIDAVGRAGATFLPKGSLRALRQAIDRIPPRE